MADKVMRNQIADYISKTTASSTYELMGTGFKTLDETVGAQTDSDTYINDTSSSSYVKGYETEFPFESHLIISQTALKDLYTVGRNHLTGSDAEFNYVRVDLFDPLTGEGNTNTYRARKFLVCAEISDCSGESASPDSVSSTWKCVGDPVLGTFNTSTKTFTADAE